MRRIHYAWWVCAGCMLMMYCTLGLAGNAFSVFPPFILRENGFSNAQSSFLMTIRSLSAFVFSMLAGRYYRCFSLRAGMTLAGLVSALGFVVYGFAKNYAGYCIGGVLVGFGFGLGSLTPVAIVIDRWFRKDCMLAISICSAMTGLATFGIPSLLTSMVENLGLQKAFLLEGAAIAGLMLISCALLRNDPQRMGLAPYGDGEAIAPSQQVHGNVILDHKDRFLLAPMTIGAGAITGAGYGHLSVYMSSLGYTPAVIAIGITVTGVALMLGKLLYGVVAERLGNRRTNTIFGLILISGLLLCCLGGQWTGMLYIALAAYGMGLALTTVGLTAMAADWSTADHYRATVQQFQSGYYAGSLAFSPIPGIIADHAGGSYLPSFVLFLVCSVYVLAAILIVYRRKQRQMR